MMKILADATLPHLSTLFADSFQIHEFHSFQELVDLLPDHDILLCRSTLKITETLLANSPIQCVATASSGLDHIDIDALNRLGITLLDAKGANAEAVADYVIASLAYLSQHHLIQGTRAGVIGHGEVGSRVAKRLSFAGFDVACFDPLKALTNKDFPYCSFSDLLQSDVLCVHANLHNIAPYPSLNLVDSHFLKQLKPGVAIINASRGGIINEQALLTLNKPMVYCTDVYHSEPCVNPDIIELATLCTPHIAGHAIEAKKATMVKLCEKLHHQYGLTMPKIQADDPQLNPIFADLNHHALDILSLYNPIHETLELKQASDKTIAFTLQRQHHLRHHFSWHPTNDSKKNTII